MKVIEQTTHERENETKELFQQCLPYLEQGIGLVEAVKNVKNINYNSFQGLRWYKDLRAYATSQGYEPLR